MPEQVRLLPLQAERGHCSAAQPNRKRVRAEVMRLSHRECLASPPSEAHAAQAVLEQQLFPGRRMRVLDHPGSLLGLLLLLVTPGERVAGSPRATVDCVCHNGDYVICDWGSRQKPLHNYSFYFWYEGLSNGSAQCEDYVRRDGLNVACRLSGPKLFNYFRMFLNGSRGPPIVPDAVNLNDRVRPGKPFNLTVGNQSNHQLLLTWKTPYRKPGCLEHSVRYKSSRDTKWMESVVVKSLEYQMASVDPKKRYTFYIKSKMNKLCATTALWSEESDSASWGEDAGPSSTKNMAILLGFFFILLMVFLAVVRMERVWVVLMPRIPNPSRKFEDLFTAYKGNFSEWAGVSKDAAEAFKPGYYENICPITELLPSGGYLPASSEASTKTGGPPDPPPDPAPKASPEPAP